MNKENLVVVTEQTQSQTFGNSIFRPNKFYRCLPDGIGYLIYGEWFNKKDFKNIFETVHERMVKQFTDLGLIVNGKPVSKNKFTQLADIHTYGNGRTSLKIWYFRNSRDVIWGFYPMQGSKAANANECYQYFTELVSGNMESIDNEDVCFGNCGVPIAYGKLRVS